MPDKKPTLEDLLRLKRCERPTEEEWAQFDERLKSKMMCRLREPRKEFSLKFPIKAIVPLGAAALAAILFVPGFPVSDDLNFSTPENTAIASAVSKTPLPSIDYSFSSNEMYPMQQNSETPVIAPMNSDYDSSIRYVSNSLPVASAFIF